MQTLNINLAVKCGGSITRSDEALSFCIKEQLGNLFPIGSKVTVNKIERSQEQPIISYPLGGARDIKKIFIRFNKNSVVSKDQAESIVEYWSSIPYVGLTSRVDWYGKTGMIVYTDVSQSRSRDVDSREILELLVDFLQNGTPRRVTKGGTRAVDGLGVLVESAVGLNEVDSSSSILSLTRRWQNENERNNLLKY